MSAVPRQATILGVLFAGVLMAALDIAIVGPALPAVQAEFGVGERPLSWVFSIYVLFNLIGAPLLAACSDRYGRRRLYMLSVATFAAGSALVAAAPSFGMLLAGRAVQAFGAGGIFPVASAVVADAVPHERRGRALGLIGAVFGVAFLLGPLLGGLLLRFGWPWLFLINLPIAAAVIAASVVVLPDDAARGERPGGFDAGGAFTLSVLLAAAAIGINAVDASSFPRSLGAPAVWPCMLIAAAAVPLLIAAERRAAHPIVPPEFFANRRLRAVGAIGLATGAVEAGMVFVPALAVGAFGVDPASASLMLLPLVLTLIAGAPAAGWFLDRIGPRPVIQAGLVATAAGLALLGRGPLGLVEFYAAGMLVGLGLSALLGAPLRYVVLAEVGDARRGAGQGVLTLSLGIGQLLGSAAIGALAASAGGGAGYAHALWPLALVIVAVLPVTFRLESGRAAARRPEPRRGAARGEAEEGS